MNATSATIAEARALREGGWSTGEIARRLSRDLGRPVARQTVRHWTDERAAERKRQRDRRRRSEKLAAASEGRVRTPHSSPAFFAARMAALHAVGLSARQVGAVMRFDFPAFTLTDSEIARRLLERPGRCDAERQIVDLVSDAGPVGLTRREIEALTGLGPNQARYAISKELTAGRIAMLGAKRGARYVHAGYCESAAA